MTPHAWSPRGCRVSPNAGSKTRAQQVGNGVQRRTAGWDCESHSICTLPHSCLTHSRESECLLYFFSVLLTNFVTRTRNLNFNTCGLTTASTHRKTSHAAHGRCTGGRNEIGVPRCLCEKLSLCSCFGFLTSLHCCVIESAT